MKYIVVDERVNDIFTEEFETLETAIQEAERQFGRMTDREKKECNGFYVLETVNPDPEAVDHMDGTPVKTWI